MLAEFVHSVADCSDQILLLVGRNRANRAKTVEHPFGYGRERFLYAFLVSVVLFSVGGAYSVYEGIHKIIHPGTITDPYVAFGVLFISAILEGYSLRTAIKESNPHRDGAGWGSFIHRAKGPDLIVVLLEDSAALIGLAFAFAGVGLSVLTHNEAWDGGGSVAIGLLLAGVAVVVARETKSLLIGEAASPAAERTIVRALEDGPEVERVIHMRTVHLSPDSLLVAAKVAVRAGDSATTVVRGIDAAESRVRAAVPIADVIYLEPDLYQEAKADEADPAIQVVQRALEHTGERGEEPAPSQPGSPAPPGPVNPPGPIRRPYPGAPALLARWGSRARSRAAEQAQRPLLLEVERPPRPFRQAPDAPAEVGQGRADRRFGKDPQAEGDRGRAYLVPAFQLEGRGHRAQVRLAELAVPWPAPPAHLPHRRQQSQILAVAEHPRGHSQPPGRLGYAHGVKLTFSCQERPPGRARGPAIPYGR